jgi:hypothetical protein
MREVEIECVEHNHKVCERCGSNKDIAVIMSVSLEEKPHYVCQMCVPLWFAARNKHPVAPPKDVKVKIV